MRKARLPPHYSRASLRNAAVCGRSSPLRFRLASLTQLPVELKSDGANPKSIIKRCASEITSRLLDLTCSCWLLCSCRGDDRDDAHGGDRDDDHDAYDPSSFRLRTKNWRCSTCWSSSSARRRGCRSSVQK